MGAFNSVVQRETERKKTQPKHIYMKCSRFFSLSLQFLPLLALVSMVVLCGCLSVSLSFMCVLTIFCMPQSAERFAACVAVMINSQMCTHSFLCMFFGQRAFFMWPEHFFLPFRCKHASPWTWTNYPTVAHTHTFWLFNNKQVFPRTQTTIKVRTFSRTWNDFLTQTPFCSFFLHRLAIGCSHLQIS